MPADPPPSLLITPDQRRRLQQRFDEAQRLAASPQPNVHRIHELLSECVRSDPGNILYLDALFANLRRRAAIDQRSPWWRRLGRWLWTLRPGQVPASSVRTASSDCHALLVSAPEALWRTPHDLPLLLGLAAAAGACDFDEAELRYLTAARALAPDEPGTLRALAQALTRQGRFEDAVGPWFAVLALAPGDAEAAEATEDLRGLAIGDNLSGFEPSVQRPFRAVQPAQQGRPTEASLDVSGHDPTSLVDLARQHRDAGNFAAAEHCLAQEHAAVGSDLALIAEREGLRLRHSEQRLAVARRRAAHDPHPKAQALVARMEDEHRRLEIELLNMQVERLPRSVELRLELARRLKRMANFSGAVQRLDEALRLAPNSAAVLIEIGECWQHLRQFAKALDDYERAVAAADHPDDAKLAAYRSGVLAAALGNAALARERLLSVVRADPAYKDARERLDNLPQS